MGQTFGFMHDEGHLQTIGKTGTLPSDKRGRRAATGDGGRGTRMPSRHLHSRKFIRCIEKGEAEAGEKYKQKEV